jgi:hypothetical protein
MTSSSKQWLRANAMVHPLVTLYRHFTKISRNLTLSDLAQVIDSAPCLDYDLVFYSSIPMGNKPNLVYKKLLQDESLSPSQLDHVVREIRQNHHSYHIKWWKATSPHIWPIVQQSIADKTYENYPQMMEEVSCDPNLPFELVKYVHTVLNNGQTFLPLLTHRINIKTKLDWKFIDQYWTGGGWRWNVQMLALHPELTLDFCKKHENMFIDEDDNIFKSVNINPSIRIEDILANRYFEWDPFTILWRKDYKTNKNCLGSTVYKQFIIKGIRELSRMVEQNASLSYIIDIEVMRIFNLQDSLNTVLEQNLEVVFSIKNWSYDYFQKLSPDLLEFIFYFQSFRERAIRCGFFKGGLCAELIMGLTPTTISLMISKMDNIMEVLRDLKAETRDTILGHNIIISSLSYNPHLELQYVLDTLDDYEWNISNIIKYYYSNYRYENSTMLKYFPWEFILVFMSDLKYNLDDPRFVHIEQRRNKLNQKYKINFSEFVNHDMFSVWYPFWFMDSNMLELNMGSILNYLNNECPMFQGKNVFRSDSVWCFAALWQMKQFECWLLSFGCEYHCFSKNKNIYQIYDWLVSNRSTNILITTFQDLVKTILPKVMQLLGSNPNAILSDEFEDLLYQFSNMAIIPFDFAIMSKSHGLLNSKSEVDFKKLLNIIQSGEKLHLRTAYQRQRFWIDLSHHPNFDWGELLDAAKAINPLSKKELFQEFICSCHQMTVSQLINLPSRFPIDKGIFYFHFKHDMQVYRIQKLLTRRLMTTSTATSVVAKSDLIRGTFSLSGDEGVINIIVQFLTGFSLQNRAILSKHRQIIINGNKKKRISTRQTENKMTLRKRAKLTC